MSEILNVLTSLGFNWHIALANFFNFLIIFFLLQKFLFRKIAITLAKRKAHIEEGVRLADESKVALQEAKASGEHLIRQAEIKSSELISLAEVKAKENATALQKEALLASEKMKAEATTLKENAYQDALKELNAESKTLLASLLEKTLSSQMTQEINDAFISKIAVKK